MASNNFVHNSPGINLVPVATTAVSVVGDIDYSLDTGAFNIFDSGGASTLSGSNSPATFTNKTIPVALNHITGTLNRAAQFNASTGDLEPSLITNTELGFVSGVTSSIQTQLNGKQASGNYITALTGDVTATGPGSVAATLASVGTAGTYVKVTTDAKGRVTSGSVSPQAIADGGTGQTSAAAAYNALSPMTTAGDIEYEITNGVAARLPIGTNGKILQVVAGLPSWQTSTALTNPMTTTGDIIYSSDNLGTPARLGIGTSGQVLEVSGGLPVWTTPTPSAGPVILAESTTDNSVVNSISTAQWKGQSFTTTTSAYVTNVVLNISQTSGPASGPMVVGIYTNSAGSPGSLLATSNSVNALSLTSTPEPITFSFNVGITLANSTQYFIVFNPSGVTFGGAVIALNTDNTDPYPGGNLVSSTNSGSTWTPAAGIDLEFNVYGNTAAITFFASSQVNTQSSNITGTSFVTFDTSPAFTFTPTITGIYKVYCGPTLLQESAGLLGTARIFNTSGGAVLINESQGAVYTTASGQILTNPFIQSVYTLISGINYVFDIQGKNNASGLLNLDGTDVPFYMFAELCG